MSEPLLSEHSAKRSPLETLDFLTENVSSEQGVTITEEGFHVRRPWALLEIGSRFLRKGWWTLDVGPTAARGSIEVRMRSPRDPYVVLRPDTVKIYLPYDALFDIDLLVSPWPGFYETEQLRLRRLSSLELINASGMLLSRALRSKHKVRKLKHVIRQVRANVPLGILDERKGVGNVEFTTTNSYKKRDENSEQRDNAPKVRAILASDDKLRPDALRLAESEFEFEPKWKVAFCDVEEQGRVVPRPEWDNVLQKYADQGLPPAFVRSGASVQHHDDLKQYIEEILATSGEQAIGRIPLPLVFRESSQTSALKSVPAPRLLTKPKVSAIIPTKYRIDLLEKCLTGLRGTTNYRELEVIVVDNGSTNPRLEPLLKSAAQDLDLRSVLDDGSFNFSRLVNYGAKHASGEVLLFLNDDIEPIESDWLNRIVESVADPAVGVVGARLLYPDGSIQHAGVAMGLGGVCGHIWKGMLPEDAERSPYIIYPAQKMAVTGACLAVRRDVFDKVKGFDEAAFPVALNDIDFCLRVHALGLKNIYRGDAVLVHHESQSRGDDAKYVATRRRLIGEIAAFISRWGYILKTDPFSSPQFDHRFETGALHPAVLNARFPQFGKGI